MREFGAAVALLAMLLVGCGGGDDTGAEADRPRNDAVGGGATATCSPSGSSLSVAAKDIQFDKSCLAAPAGQAFTIKFDNNDALPHNVNILTSLTATESFFVGEQITGPNRSVTYKVSSLKAGTYNFRCIVHPDQMRGTFVVK